MKSRYLMLTTALPLFAALAIPVRLGAQDEKRNHKHHHYQLIDMGTFGGPQSYINDGFGGLLAVSIVNKCGQFTGWADTSLPDPFLPNFCFDTDCFTAHAFRWQDGDRTDLNALPNGASSAPTSISKSGLIAGLSENGEIDPLIPGFPVGHAVLWQNGGVTDLGTLEGGYESVAYAVNNGRQVAGVFTNTTADPNSMSGTGYQARAFLWQGGVMQDLGTLGGPDAQALLINERGQVVGWSYTSFNPGCGFAGLSLTTGSFIWEEAEGMKDLGSLGGTCTTAADINNRGQVVGASNLTGDQSFRAFLWQNGVLHDLGDSFGGDISEAFALNEAGETVGVGFLPGDTVFHAALWKRIGQMTDLGTVISGESNFAESINAKTQVVGAEYDSSGAPSAFLWENDSIADLNTLIRPASQLHLQFSLNINDRGEIAATSVDANGNQHATLLIPCDENHPNVDGCDYSLVDAAAATRENAASVIQKPTTTAPRTDHVDRIPRRRPGPLPHLLRPKTGSADDQETPISRDPAWHLEDKIGIYDDAEPAAESSSKSSCGAAQPLQRCIPIGGACYGPGRLHCCPPGFPHHSFCSNRTGWGTCIES